MLSSVFASTGEPWALAFARMAGLLAQTLLSAATSQRHSPASLAALLGCCPSPMRGGAEAIPPCFHCNFSSPAADPSPSAGTGRSYPCRRLDTGLRVAHAPAARYSRPSHQEPSLKQAKISSVCISQFILKRCKPRLLVPLPCLQQPKPSRMALTHSALEQNKRVSPRALHKVGHSPASKSWARAQGRTKPWAGDTRAVLQPPG